MSNVRPHMSPSESVVALEKEIESTGSSLPEINPRLGVGGMLAFYAKTDAEGCAGPSADMLLFEWGTYDWGEGESFELGISRQFTEIGEEGEPEISQLRLVFQYGPTSVFAAFGEGNRWCSSRAELAAFTAHIQSNPAYVALAEVESPSVRLSHAYA